MSRRIRYDAAGAIHHVRSHGNRNEPVVRDDEDARTFVETLKEAATKSGWKIHAWCVIPTAFELVLETTTPTLVAGMKWFLGTYTKRFHKRHRTCGHVFAGRYHSRWVAPGTWLADVCDHVHLFPALAGLAGPGTPLTAHAWSSLVQEARWGAEAGRLETIRAGDLRAHFATLDQSWCHGPKSFQKELAIQFSEHVGGCHHGPELQAASEAVAERIVQEELRLLELTDAMLKTLPKGDAKKLVIAKKLRKNSNVTLQWIAARLRMGTGTYLSHLLYWDGRTKPVKKNQNRKVPDSSGSVNVSLGTPVAPDNNQSLPLADTGSLSSGFDVSLYD